MESVLITAIDHVLGISLAARYLASSPVHVIYLLDNSNASFVEELGASVCRALEESLAGPDAAEYAQQVKDRFHVVEADCTREAAGLFQGVPDGFAAGQIWFVSGGCFPARRSNQNSITMRMLNAALSHAARTGAAGFNYVYTALGSADSDHESARLQRNTKDDVIAQCGNANLPCRIFQTALVLGRNAHLGHRDGFDFAQFLEALHGLRTEIHNREPEYFDFHPLRCWMPPHLALNVIQVNTLAERMTAIAWSAAPCSEYFLASSKCEPFTDLCDPVGTAYDVSLLLVQDKKELNAVDLLMDQRLDWIRQCLVLSQEYAASNPAPPDSVAFDVDASLAILQDIRQAQDAAYAANSQRIARLHSQIEKRQIQRNGSDLVYFTGGSGGTPLIIINALGQGLQYWYGLIDKLLPHHRIIFWELRGLALPVPFQISDHVDDIGAILRHEGIEKCHLLAWCTGPKIAMQCYLRFPNTFTSLVFLNSSFKCPGSPKDLCSAYEDGLEEFCQVLDMDPELGAVMIESLRESGEPGFSGGNGNREPAVEVLSKINADLKPYVMAPFRDVSTAVNYARQVLEFYSYDAREHAKQVQVPVLLIASELDSIAAPAASRAALEMFPAARCLQIQGATHQCLYDRPNLIAGLIEDFFLDPVGAIGHDGEVKEIGAALQSA